MTAVIVELDDANPYSDRGTAITASFIGVVNDTVTIWPYPRSSQPKSIVVVVVVVVIRHGRIVPPTGVRTTRLLRLPSSSSSSSSSASAGGSGSAAGGGAATWRVRAIVESIFRRSVGRIQRDSVVAGQLRSAAMGPDKLSENAYN